MSSSTADGGIQPDGRSGDKRSGWLGPAAWCFYDWANSAFPTVITTFIFAAYFAQAVAENPIDGTVFWSRALTVAGLIVAISSPLLGAIADHSGSRKPWILVFTLACVILTGLLWYTEPDPAFVTYALILYACASVTYQFAIVFYDAMLPHVAPPHLLGRYSGWGWALGYVGGLLCLGSCLWLVTGGGEMVLGLDKETQEPVRAVAPFVALWFALFTLPLLLFTPDRDATGKSFMQATRAGLGELPRILAELKRSPQIFRFLVAHMLYTDGLTTLFAFGGIYAAAEFGMQPEDILIFGIVLNVAAGIGAACLAWVDDLSGSKVTIILSLCCLIMAVTGLLLVYETWQFWTLAIILGMFVGPAQAAGRSLMARLSPDGKEAEMFGLYAMAGKATVFAGPFVLGLIVQQTGSQRIGMITVIAFLALGLAVLLTVKAPPQPAQRK